MNSFNPTIRFAAITSDGHLSFLEQLIKMLGGSMEKPTAYGWFHLVGILLIIIACVLVFLFARNASEKTVNWILGGTAVTMVILEIYKQLTFSYDPATDVWDYQWYAFPFQFCATPMYVMSVACFLKQGKLKTSLCSYLATYGLFAGLAVILYPNNIFVETIGINIHALLHHAAMLAIGIIMFVTGKVELSHKTILRALPVFAVFISIALTANVLYGEFLYPLTGETCNLFYISPYFPCQELPVLSSIYGNVPYLVFLAIYAFGFTFAGYLMTLIGMGLRKLYQFITSKVKAINKKRVGKTLLIQENLMKTIAIVTGASSGIGKEFFLSLNDKKDGLDEIWVIARNENKLNELRDLTSVPLRVFPLDLSLSESTAVIEKALQEENPSVRYLICASGFGRFNGVADDEREVLENMVDLNCRSIVSITKVCFDYMEKGGTMMLIASMAALQPIPYIATYGATKAFVLSYGRALHRELRKEKGARCLCVCPFWTKTAFFDRAYAEKTIVKKYAVMYKPEQIVKQAWKDWKKKNRDVSIYGATAKGQALLVKLLPHRMVMWVWMKQQGLN